MQYNLIFMDNFKDGDFQTKWDFSVKADSIFASDDCRIDAIATYSSTVSLHLSKIPERIDAEDTGCGIHVWLLDNAMVSRSPEPYNTDSRSKSTTVFTKHN